MARTRSTRTTGLSPNWGTSSGTNPGEDLEGPQDISDVAQLDIEIPRGSRRPTGGLLQPKATPRTGVGLEIGKSAGGGLGVGVSIPIGGPISARGGINIGAGGEIKGAQVGIGIGAGPIGASVDVGTDQDEEGRGGCYQYVTVTVGPFSHTYGRNVCEPKPPAPTPTPTPSISRDNPPGESTPGQSPPNFEIGKEYWKKDSVNQYFRINRNISPVGILPDNYSYTTPVPNYGLTCTAPGWTVQIIAPVNIFYYNVSLNGSLTVANFSTARFKRVSTSRYTVNQGNDLKFFQVGEIDKEYFRQSTNTTEWILISYSASEVLEVNPSPIAIVFQPLSPPVPNPPPTKKMDDKCCKQSLILQAEILRLLGRELGPEGLVPQTKKIGFIGEEFERVQTPIENPTNPKKIKVRFETIYELLMYVLKQANNLDVALDPQSYKIPTGKIQNPAYNRDSKQSLLNNSEPTKDEAGNKRELEINKDDEVKMGGFLQQQNYVFHALRRLEYLFPYGELSDALIAKSLLIPGAEGEIRIHNMIMAYELQMQYLNATFGNPREVLTIKDANPALAGDQSVEIKALTLSDWLRQVVKFQMDTGGDVDALINLELRDFRTGMANRTDIVKTAEMVQALFEDSGMREQQDYISLHLEGDPYAGQWVKGQGFQANPDLEKKTEEATEKVLRETIQPTDIKIKVSRRHKDEKTDMRDLLRGLADFVQRLLSVPVAGDAATSIDKLIESAKFKIQTDAALLRQNITQAAAASRNRTRKRKK